MSRDINEWQNRTPFKTKEGKYVGEVEEIKTYGNVNISMIRKFNDCKL